jgi:hypothetical protein
MRDWLTLAYIGCVLAMAGVIVWQSGSIDTLKAERDTALAQADGYRERAELNNAIADKARAEHLLISYRLAEIEARGPERVTVYRDRVRVIEPLPAVCGPGADRVAAVNEALR